jgi:hypothetical protein
MDACLWQEVCKVVAWMQSVTTTDTWTAVAYMLEGRSHFGCVAIRSAGPAEEQDLFDTLIAQTSSREF